MRRGIHSNNRRELSEGRDPFLTTCSSETDSYRADMGLRFRVRGLCVEAQTMRPLSKSKQANLCRTLRLFPMPRQCRVYISVISSYSRAVSTRAWTRKQEHEVYVWVCFTSPYTLNPKPL